MSKLSYLVFFILLSSIVCGQLVKLPFGTNSSSATVLDISILTLCLIGLIKTTVTKEKLNLKKTSLIIQAALLFTAAATISLILSPLKLNLNQNLQSFLYTIRFLGFILLAWLFSKKILPIKNLNLILIISGLTLAITGLLQLIFIPNLNFLATSGWDPHYFRTVSTFLDPNFLGAYLVLILLLIIQIPTDLSPKLKRVIFLVIYLALITTFSRSSAVMFLTSFLTLTIFKKSKSLLLLTIVLLIGFGISYIAYNKLVATPRNISRTNSAEFRLNSWQQGLGEFYQSPIFGVGFNAYRYGLIQYKLAPENQLQSRGSSSNDSSLLFVAATTGIVGLLSFLTFLFFIFKTALSQLKERNYLSLTLISGLTGLLINSFFINSLFYPFILLWLFLIISQLLVNSKMK